VAAQIDGEVRKLITQAHEEAHEILTTHRDALDRIADVLMSQETIDAKNLAEVFVDVPKWEHTESGAIRIKMPEQATAESGFAAATTDTPSSS